MKEQFYYFWSGPFSQWSASPFVINGELYSCAEQYMMAEKARFFKDWSSADKIMAATTPDKQKSLGRMIRPFEEEAWTAVRTRIVYIGNYFKFTQNKKHYDALMSTDGYTLVEASPVDNIWGIGLAEDDPRAASRDTWLGKNLLGEILTCLRDDLKKNISIYQYK